MKLQIKEEILSIYKKIQNANFEIYLVGGCVRSLLLNQEVQDWDLATNANPEQIQILFPNSFYDNSFGTVGIPFETRTETKPLLKNYLEITTFRTEGAYKDKRRPDFVTWGKTIEEDLGRRDFTINAIALKLNSNDYNLEPIIIDPFGGKKDLENKLIRAVGEAEQRFKEDALRLMRAIRIASQLGFSIEEKTWKALIKNSALIKHVSAERTRDELLKILKGKFPYEGVKMLDNAKILELVIPELAQGKGISQERPGRHHTSDVFTHCLLSLKFCPSTDPIVRFATLIHDIGKPKVIGQDENGLVIFYNHEISGAKITRNICQRLRFSRQETERISTLVRWHMFAADEKLSDAGIRRFIRRIGVENVNDMIDLRIGDRLGGGTQAAESWRLKLFKKRLQEQLKPAPFSINDLAVNGNDIMKELNIKPGPKIGELLKRLFEEVDEDLSKNNKKYLIPRIQEIAKEL